jgi:hypothetical protein
MASQLIGFRIQSIHLGGHMKGTYLIIRNWLIYISYFLILLYLHLFDSWCLIALCWQFIHSPWYTIDIVCNMYVYIYTSPHMASQMNTSNTQSVIFGWYLVLGYFRYINGINLWLVARFLSVISSCLFLGTLLLEWKPDLTTRGQSDQASTKVLWWLRVKQTHITTGGCLC